MIRGWLDRSKRNSSKSKNKPSPEDKKSVTDSETFSLKMRKTRDAKPKKRRDSV